MQKWTSIRFQVYDSKIKKDNDRRQPIEYQISTVNLSCYFMKDIIYEKFLLSFFLENSSVFCCCLFLPCSEISHSKNFSWKIPKVANVLSIQSPSNNPFVNFHNFTNSFSKQWIFGIKISSIYENILEIKMKIIRVIRWLIEGSDNSKEKNSVLINYRKNFVG